MIRRPPISTRTYTLFPYTTLFRSLPQPILIKCSGGGDRTSLAAALHLLDRVLPGDTHDTSEITAALAAARRQLAGIPYFHWPRKEQDRKSTRLNSSH